MHPLGLPAAWQWKRGCQFDGCSTGGAQCRAQSLLLLHAPQDRVRHLIETVRLTDVPKVHVESCTLVAHPQSYID
jgi:hypothetical protein